LFFQDLALKVRAVFAVAAVARLLVDSDGVAADAVVHLLSYFGFLIVLDGFPFFVEKYKFA